MTTAQMNAIASPAVGLEIFNLDDSCIYVRRSLSWVSTCSNNYVTGANFTVSNGLTKTGSNVTLGGTLTQATTITQASNNFNITGGNVGIGITTPKSTLDVTGSMSIAFRYVVDPYTITAADNVVLAEPSSGSGGGPYANLTLTLPSAVTAGVGRIYTVGKVDETTANTVTFSPPLYVSTTTTISVINYAVNTESLVMGQNGGLSTSFNGLIIQPLSIIR